VKRFGLILVVAFASCAQLGPRGLKTSTELYEDGTLKCRYTFYVDATGAEVLQGTYESWSLHGTIKEVREYRQGRLVSTTISSEIVDVFGPPAGEPDISDR
jgi:hypothetical protein